MNTEKYFISLTNELCSLKDRVRLYMEKDIHWLTDGEWKESVLRAILRRHLPATIGVGRGFVISKSDKSSQIDILLYDKTKPILFQDGEFVLVTTDTVKGVIEVKTRIQKSELQNVLDKLSNVAEFINLDVLKGTRFFGLFVYEDKDMMITSDILETLYQNVQGKDERTINCISLGINRFIRFWHLQPSPPRKIVNKWHAYRLENMAPAYFIHNVIDHLNPQWASNNNNIWYPSSTKEPCIIGEIERNIS